MNVLRDLWAGVKISTCTQKKDGSRFESQQVYFCVMVCVFSQNCSLSEGGGCISWKISSTVTIDCIHFIPLIFKLIAGHCGNQDLHLSLSGLWSNPVIMLKKKAENVII